jgi:hypothetical protein
MTTINSDLRTEYIDDEEKLEQSQIELLVAIRLLQEQTELGHGQFKNLLAKKAQFNQIADIINSLQTKNRSDPIDRLPPEIFIQIISNAASSVSGDRGWIDQNHSFLLLTLVSTRWMNFIINTPLFWTSVILDESIPHCFSIAATFLQLSRQLPISVKIKWSLTLEGSTIWSEIQKHRNRITRLICDLTSCGTEQASIELRKFIEKLSPLPLLDILDYVGWVSSDHATTQYILDVFPNISQISGLDLSITSIQRLMSRSCKNIVLSGNFNPMFSLLEGNPALRTVSHRMPRRLISSLPSEKTNPIVRRSVKWTNLYLSYLTVSLSIDITERVTELVSLSIYGYLDSLMQLFINIDRLCRLRELSLGFFIGRSEGIEISGTPFSTNTNIKYLKLSLQMNLYIDEARPVEKMFYGLMMQSLPAVQSLSLIFRKVRGIPSVSKLFDMKVLTVLLNLQRLTLYSQLSIDSFKLPPCEILNLTLPSQSAFKFSNQTCRQLDVSWNTFSVTNRAPDDHSLHNQSWPLLEKLTIPASFIVDSHIGFPHLREIFLKCGISQVELTRFCVSLALHPTFCPVLGELYMDQCPEWDIFFIMLERRLMWRINGSQPFRSITLPDHTPRSILRYICDILRGRFPERPSNYDLSLFATFEIISDKTMCASI